MRKARLSAASPVSRRSWVGLNAANFFLAEMMGVVMPFLGKYLKGQGWSETALGVAISAAGLGVFLTQTPAGLITDRVRQRRALLAGASLLVGICFGLVPWVPARPGWVAPLLFLGGMAQSVFLPLLAAVALFHLANARVMPFVGAYIDKLGGSGVQVAAVVLVAQAVMVPVSLLTGILCDRWGRKPAFAVGFLALPVRIFLYSLTRDPWVLVALQALDGLGAGVYGVAVVAMCADLTREKGGFNAVQGMLANAVAVGGVLGPLGAGWLADRLGYEVFF